MLGHSLRVAYDVSITYSLTAGVFDIGEVWLFGVLLAHVVTQT